MSEQAYHQIRNEILSGDLLVGDMLSRRRLADRLSMSFLPITEALRRLETEGLVESRPRIGTRVRIPTEQDIRDSNVIREALESQAARLCAERITEEEKKQLLTSAQHLDDLQAVCAKESVDSRFMVSVHTYHMEFHIRIANFARCPGLWLTFRRSGKRNSVNYLASNSVERLLCDAEQGQQLVLQFGELDMEDLYGVFALGKLVPFGEAEIIDWKFRSFFE